MADIEARAASVLGGDLDSREDAAEHTSVNDELEAQRRLWAEQRDQIQALRRQQVELTGTDPLQEENDETGDRAGDLDVEAGQKAADDFSSPLKGKAHSSTSAQAELSSQHRESLAGPAGPGPSPEKLSSPAAEDASAAARVSRLSPAAEQALLTFFALQDTLTRDTARLLAEQAQCSEQQVNEYFMRLRSGVRGYLLKLQRKASGKPTGSHASPASPGIPSAVGGRQSADEAEDLASLAREQHELLDTEREAGLRRLRGCGAESGGVRSPEAAERLLGQLGSFSGWHVREACVQSLERTSNPLAVKQLSQSSTLVEHACVWIEAAEVDGQVGFLWQLLRALLHLEVEPSSRSGAALLTSLTQLQNHRSQRVADQAKLLLEHFKSPRIASQMASGPRGLTKEVETGAPSVKTIPVFRPVAQVSKSMQNRKRPAEEQLRARTESLKRQVISPLAKGLEQRSKGIAAKAEVTSPSTSKFSRAAPMTLQKPSQVKTERKQEDSATRQYREFGVRLQKASTERRNEEMKRRTDAIADGRARSMQPQLRGTFRAPLLALNEGPGNLPAGRGEDSLEMAIQAQRVARQAAATDPLLAEPDQPPSQRSGAPTCIPFVPEDADEAREHMALQQASGITLPHLLLISKQGRG